MCKLFNIFLCKILFFEKFMFWNLKNNYSNIIRVEIIKVPWKYTILLGKVVMIINPLAFKKNIALTFLLNEGAMG
jgi:hypothetical protein